MAGFLTGFSESDESPEDALRLDVSDFCGEDSFFLIDSAFLDFLTESAFLDFFTESAFLDFLTDSVFFDFLTDSVFFDFLVDFSTSGDPLLTLSF